MINPSQFKDLLAQIVEIYNLLNKTNYTIHNIEVHTFLFDAQDGQGTQLNSRVAIRSYDDLYYDVSFDALGQPETVMQEFLISLLSTLKEKDLLNFKNKTIKMN